MVFSVLSNINEFIKNKKDVDLFKKSHIIRYQRSSKYIAENSKKFYNDIENEYYTLKEFAIFLLYKHMMNESVNLYNVKPNTIIEVMKLFTTKKLKEDLKLLSIIHKELKFKKIEDYFEIKEDGTNIAYILTKKNKISPIFYIRNFENVLTDINENVIFKSKEYKQFEKIARKIKETLKGGLVNE
jgi:hypothetical protein